MAANGNGNGWKNYVLTILATLFVAGAVGYVTFARGLATKDDIPTREQHAAQIQRDSPYMEDRKLILGRLNDIAEINRRLGVIETEVAAVKALINRSHTGREE